MAASSSSESSSASQQTWHDIFLSHSGANKGFVKGLYTMLSPIYSTFFDIQHHSLPPGENFPKRILSAAGMCRLAVVVLSDEFVCSKWPMIELCAFVDAARSSSMKILPLFYKLSPGDLKDMGNLERWRKAWEAYATEDPTRIVVSKWAHALKTLCSQNGLTFDPSEGELSYLEKIVSSISEIVPPGLKCEDSGIHGKDRLCKIILAKFKELEWQYQQSKVCVLGMYGLPGSGKSTLSMCLRDHFFPHFAGKVLHLELPTNPTPAELIDKSKELLVKLTDFKNRINLNNVSDLRQMKSLLKAYNLPSCRVFLVVDNISSEHSVEAVEAILQLGVGPGSKVLLVARTLDVLRPLLHKGQYDNRYICGSMSIPSINETEAIRILLQSGAGLQAGLAGLQAGCALVEDHLTPMHREIMVDVVRKCGFGPTHEHVYLPLVMERMGVLLKKYEKDVEKWGSEMGRFWERVNEYKKDAVRELVEKSFRELPTQLQLVFLDVALFILPSQTSNVREACVLLSFLHDSSTDQRIKMEMQDLERNCFLRFFGSEIISVHDVYLEFAESIQESSMYFSSRRRSWRTCNKAAEVPRELSILQDHTKAQLRAIILEAGEGCERVDFQGFSGVKALVVRNSKSLAVLGLTGLTSLVSLNIEECPSMEQVELAAGSSLLNLRRLILSNKQGNLIREERSMMQVQEWKQLPYKYNWLRMITASGWPRAPQRPLLEVALARQMRGLQVLTLEETGIRRLGDMSSCWPQLRELEVFENRLESFEIGNFPRLKRFVFSDRGRENLFKSEGNRWYYRRGFDREEDGNPRRLRGMDLLMGCPELEEVRMLSASFENLGTLPSNLQTLWLRQSHHVTKLPDLAVVAQSLEMLEVFECRKIESVKFVCRFGRLTKLTLDTCPSLVEVSGLGCLPSLRSLAVRNCPGLHSLFIWQCPDLRDLIVKDCSNLRALSGLEHLRMLVKLDVSSCEKLGEISGLNGLVSVEDLFLNCCPNVSVLSSALENFDQAKVLSVSGLLSGCTSFQLEQPCGS